MARMVNTSSTMTELDKLYDLIDGMEIAMMTTRRPDGHLESRAMATQKRAAGADLWFVTLEDSAKVRDIAADPHVNLAYYRDMAKGCLTGNTPDIGEMRSIGPGR